MRRTLFTPEHGEFRALARAFFEKECAPYAAEWEAAGLVDRDVWRKAGAVGLLGWEAPTEYGGTGIRDYRYNAIMTEEFVASGSAGFGFALHNDVLPSYLIDLTTDEQKARWLPRWVTGEAIGALAMTEPGAGSDLKAMRTAAVADGDDYVINGSKTYITNGIHADIVVLAARTGASAGHKGISLIVVERGMTGFTRGRRLDKIGKRGQDTAELFFEDVRVPRTNLLGEENKGFYYLMSGLARERVACAVTASALMERALELTVEFARRPARCVAEHAVSPRRRQSRHSGLPHHDRSRDRAARRGNTHVRGRCNHQAFRRRTAVGGRGRVLAAIRGSRIHERV